MATVREKGPTMWMRAKARCTDQPPALPGETRWRSLCGREGGRYSQDTTCSDRLRGRRFSGATRFPGQSPGLDCLARLRAPTIRPTNSRPVSGTPKLSPGHMTALKGQPEHRTVAGDSAKRSSHLIDWTEATARKRVGVLGQERLSSWLSTVVCKTVDFFTASDLAATLQVDRWAGAANTCQSRWGCWALRRPAERHRQLQRPEPGNTGVGKRGVSTISVLSSPSDCCSTRRR